MSVCLSSRICCVGNQWSCMWTHVQVSIVFVNSQFSLTITSVGVGVITMTGNTESQYLLPASKKITISLASNLFAFVTVFCLGFSCAIIEKSLSASAVSSPYSLLFPVARTAPLYCRQVLMVSRRDLALHCRLHSCIISLLRSTVICSQLEESWEFGISYLFSKSLSWLWRDVKKGVKIKRKQFIF